MPWGAIRGCFSAARKFCVPSKALTNLFGQLAVSSLVLALELFAMSRISLTARQASKGILLHYENLFGLHYGEDYSSVRLTSDEYRTDILPRLERAYKLMTEQYGLMTASFLRVLILQRMLYENETEYIDALERTWTSSIALRGYLLEGALGTSHSKEIETPMGDMENPQSIGEGMRTFG